MLKMKCSNKEWRVVPHKCLFYVATQTEIDQYTLIEKSAHLVLLKLAFTNTIYSYITSS